MLTFLLIVLAVLVVLGMSGMVWAAFKFNDCLLSSLWLMCGGFGHCAELLGELLAGIAKGLTGND